MRNGFSGSGFESLGVKHVTLILSNAYSVARLVNLGIGFGKTRQHLSSHSCSPTHHIHLSYPHLFIPKWRPYALCWPSLPRLPKPL